jgi:hypothetical protein
MRVAHYAGDATIAVAEADPVPPGPADVQMGSRVEPLGSAAEAFSALESGDGVMKVLVDCRGVEG